jgi:hypothetical protein
VSDVEGGLDDSLFALADVDFLGIYIRSKKAQGAGGLRGATCHDERDIP